MCMENVAEEVHWKDLIWEHLVYVHCADEAHCYSHNVHGEGYAAEDHDEYVVIDREKEDGDRKKT